MLYLLPDMDYGPNDSVFVPFFAMPDAATIPSLSRFARLGRAKVVALYSRMTPEGYVAELTPAWENFPTEDHVADTARMNRELEAGHPHHARAVLLGAQALQDPARGPGFGPMAPPPPPESASRGDRQIHKR